jgi:hypothetical protein
MKKTSFLSLFALLLTVIFIASCKPDEPVDPNEEEVITKVTLTFTDVTTGAVVLEAIYADPDGAGGAGPVRFDSIRLDSAKTYNVRVALYDESDASNIKNVTTEVQAEAAEHLFCYTPTGANVVVTKTDSDGTFPIGITTSWAAGLPSTGTMRVELRHQPDGAKNGTCAPGSTDVQLDFVVIVN